MKRILLPTLLAAAIAGTLPAHAAQTDAALLAEIRAMQSRLAQLESKVGELQQENAALRTEQVQAAEKVAAVEQAANTQSPAEKAIEAVELFGTVEVGAYAGKGYNNEDTSDLTVDTAAIGMNAQLNDYSSAEISLLYEEGGTELDVDTASITYAKEGNPFALQLGQTYLPFGAYSTQLVNDTLALQIAETRETAAIAGFSQNGFTAQAYVFNGDIDHDSATNDTLQNWGARLAWQSAEEAGSGVGLDYINNIADSDAIQSFVEDKVTDAHLWLRDERSAWSAHAYTNVGPVLLTAEYLTSDNFSEAEIAAATDIGKSPQAWQLEGAYTTQLFEREYTFAMAWQETEDALFLELPERRQSIGASTALDEKTSLAMELWRDTDYSVTDGGTGDTANNIGLLLTREF
jgi:hypothetical protein